MERSINSRPPTYALPAFSLSRGQPPAKAISALTVKPELAHMIAEFLGERDETRGKRRSRSAHCGRA